jgi:vancomycin resistance protein YoaR
VLRDGWLTGERPLELPTTAVEPDITQAEAEEALTTVAEPFAAAPVVVAVGDQSVELPVDVLTSLASFVPQESELALTLDGPRLVDEVVKRTTGLLTPASDARFEFVDDAPVIVPGTPGTTMDPAALAAAVVAAGTGQDRTARIELVSSDPAQSTQALEALGIKEIVSEFSTPLTNEPDRTENLRVGASKVTGDLVKPGEVFSLTEALGPVTAEAGFNNATVIVNGEHVPGVGGGLSQMATTTYNAAFFAGFEDVEHQPHSEWFARYPEGRESTLYTGVIDMKFKNTSPYGALMQSWVAGGRLNVRIWGTKHFTVETSTSRRSNVVAPTTVHSSSPTCTPSSAGNPGFQVTVTRRVLLAGVEQGTTSDTWRYKPQNAVVCD